MGKKQTNKQNIQKKPISEMGDTEMAALAHPDASMDAQPVRKLEASEEGAKNLQMKQSHTSLLREVTLIYHMCLL